MTGEEGAWPVITSCEARKDIEFSGYGAQSIPWSELSSSA